MEYNPYTSPKAKLETDFPDIQKQGKYTVVHGDVSLPNHCIKCGGEEFDRFQNKKLYWVNPWWYLLILVNIFVLIIASFFVQKKLKISYSLCKEHSRKRIQRRMAFLFSFLLILASGFLAITQGPSNEDLAFALGFTSGAGLLVWLIVLIIFKGDMKIAKSEMIQTEEKKIRLFYLKGVGDAFLQKIGVSI